MIKFFRKIRQNLLTNGKIGQYLKYALGEIILVVFGILIAVQINNWYEWRKDQVKEKIILQDVADNIKINIQTFRNDIDLLREWNRSSDIIIHSLVNKQDYSDTLRQHFHSSRITKQSLFLSDIGYQAYKNKGLDIVTNKVLSAEIVKLYEVTLPGILATNNLVNEIYPDWDNHIVLNFDFVEGIGLTPNDYPALFKDHFYMSWARAYRQGRNYLISTDQTLIKECERVLQLIHNELKL